MLKSIGTINLALATLFVVPAVTGQDEGASSLEAQLDATISSLEYIAGLRSSVEAGENAALRAVVHATEPARDASPQRAARLQTLRDDIARLRFTLDRMLADPSEVAAITSLPPSVVRTLGLAGDAPSVPDVTTTAPSDPATTGQLPGGPISAGPVSDVAPFEEVFDPNHPDADERGVVRYPKVNTSTESDPVTTAPILPGPTATDPPPANPGPVVPTTTVGAGDRPRTIDASNPYAARPDFIAGTSPTTGLGDSMRSAIQGEIRPLDGVSDASRRRGNEPLDLEGKGYVADPVRLGKLLVRADRPAEAIEVLERAPKSTARSYWLARAYQSQDRLDEAIEIFRELAADTKAGEFRRFAEQDIKFLEFKRSFDRSRRR